MKKNSPIQSLSELLNILGRDKNQIKNLSESPESPQKSPSFSHISIKKLTLDSRSCEAGSLFFALQGSQKDGHQFIFDAIKNGCSAVLCEPFKISSLDKKKLEKLSIPVLSLPNLREKLGLFANQFFPLKSKLKLIGITGTNGKTSVTHFIAQALNHLKQPCGVIGTLGNTGLTTPDRFALGELLSGLPATVAMEVSSHALDQNRIADLPFHMAIFTNLSHDHLDYHQTLKAYAEAKAKLFALPSLEYAVLNQDDDYFSLFKNALLPSIKLFTYSLHSNKADIHLISASENNIPELVIQTPIGEIRAKIQLWGEFNFYNILAVVGALLHLNYGINEIQNALEILTPPKGRLEKIKLANQAIAVIDYAHTPDALEKILIALKKHTPKKLICLFGCGGDRDRSKRQKMAAAAEKHASFTILTEDNSRFEDPEQIFQDIYQGFSSEFKKTGTYKIIPSRAQAIKTACQMAEAGDVILLAGKGHETYLDIQGQKMNFDERDFLTIE
jgi:UDP-N-acetylmuramoyl-L-alanyl-D-glutamate--2,6-diaminopimelate ligase